MRCGATDNHGLLRYLDAGSAGPHILECRKSPPGLTFQKHIAASKSASTIYGVLGQPEVMDTEHFSPRTPLFGLRGINVVL